MNPAFLQARLTAVEAQIVATETAILSLSGANGVQSYNLDDGQTRQSVTRADLPQLRKALESMYNLYDTLYTRLNGGGSSIGRPAW